MAIAAWKRIEKSPGYQKRKLFFKRLAGRELWLRRDLRIDAVRDGGWWLDPSSLSPGSVVYSLGVGEDTALDVALIEQYGAVVHAFDPTPSSVALVREMHLPEAFRFHPWAIAGADGQLTFYPRVRKDGTLSDVMYTQIPEDAARDHGIRVPAYTLGTVVEKLGHDRIDLLKMDIEGAEYDVLEGMLRSPIRPHQLLVEFHHRFPGIGKARTAAMIDRLREAGYRIFAVSETGREVSFMHTD